VKCPTCDGKSFCVDSRASFENTRRRRWVCQVKKCGTKFTTIEQVTDVGDVRGRERTLDRFRRQQSAGQMSVALQVIRQRVMEAFDAPYLE
jgi:transcriptional regulator NrdR family protein